MKNPIGFLCMASVALALNAAQAQLLINEVDLRSTIGGDFVELYNTGSSTIDLAAENYLLVIVSDTPSPPYHQTTAVYPLTGTVAPGQHWVIGRSTIPGVNQPIASAWLPDDAGVALYKNSQASDFPLFQPHPADRTDDLVDAVLTSMSFGSASAQMIAILAPGWNEMSEAAGAGSFLTDSVQRFPSGSGAPRDFSTFVASVATPGAVNGYIDNEPPAGVIGYPINSNTVHVLINERVQPGSVTASKVSLRRYTGTFTNELVATASTAVLLSTGPRPGQIISATFPTTLSTTETYRIDVESLVDLSGNTFGFGSTSTQRFYGGPLSTADIRSLSSFGCNPKGSEHYVTIRGTVVSARQLGSTVFMIQDDNGKALYADYSFFANPANAYDRYSKRFEINEGDTVVATGTLAFVCNAPFITGASFQKPSFIFPISSGTPAELVPQPITIPDLNATNLYEYVILEGVQINTVQTNFVSGANYELIPLGKGSVVGYLHVDADTDIAGNAIPTGSVTIEGYIIYNSGRFTITPTSITGISIGPLTAGDWQNYE